jgi:hypothetical protein
MKVRLIAAVCSVVFVVCAASTPAGAQYATNVVLEGPWILYVDKTLIGSTNPVLVAVSPGGVYNEGNTNMFHTPWVSAGDGYPVGKPNIYCLHWGDEKCAPTVSTSTALVPLTIPEKAPLLPMSAPTPGKTSWSWASKAGITAFILPMPDSYSDVAGWYMRFAPQWDITGNSYNPYPDKVEKHSIGIELHYKNGPSYSTGGTSYFSLDECAVSGSDKLGACSDAGGDLDHATKLDNVGTLSITMKSPTADPCDPHVRMAYSMVLALLDGDNHLYRAIDTAKTTYKSGAPEYDEPNDNPRCLTEYPTSFVAEVKGTDVAANSPVNSEKLDAVTLWTNQLSQFSSRIGEYLQKHNRDDENKKLLLSQIQTAIKNMNMDFPKFSQMRLLIMLLKRSEAQADSMLGLHVESQTSLMPEIHTGPANRMTEAQAKSPAVQTSAYWSTLLNISLTVPSLALLDRYFLDAAPLTKSGNDCNAPLILATTP